MIKKPPTARVLVADDDPVTLTFFQATLEQFGCDVVAVSSGSAALVAARNDRFDLLLLDRRMPDLGGCRLLAALRGEDIQTPAIATSADIDAATTQELMRGGFHSVVAKPLSTEQLREAMQPLLASIMMCGHSNKVAAMPILDDATALAASGDNTAIMQKLRGLLAAELEALPVELEGYREDADLTRLHERLHRLKASCGFCGAPALARATDQLDGVLRETPHDAQSAFTDLLGACQQTLEDLRRQDKSPAAGN